jgi:hypothetical protein
MADRTYGVPPKGSGTSGKAPKKPSKDETVWELIKRGLTIAFQPITPFQHSNPPNVAESTQHRAMTIAANAKAKPKKKVPQTVWPK